eukprot:5056723-Ditylum_brightwellii.AAC.1
MIPQCKGTSTTVQCCGIKNDPVGSWRNDYNEHLWKFNMQCSILDVERCTVGVRTVELLLGCPQQSDPTLLLTALSFHAIYWWFGVEGLYALTRICAAIPCGEALNQVEVRLVGYFKGAQAAFISKP